LEVVKEGFGRVLCKALFRRLYPAFCIGVKGWDGISWIGRFVGNIRSGVWKGLWISYLNEERQRYAF
jgi:hypothetical protein